jgi:hypothetical protein
VCAGAGIIGFFWAGFGVDLGAGFGAALVTAGFVTGGFDCTGFLGAVLGIFDLAALALGAGADFLGGFFALAAGFVFLATLDLAFFLTGGFFFAAGFFFAGGIFLDDLDDFDAFFLAIQVPRDAQDWSILLPVSCQAAFCEAEFTAPKSVRRNIALYITRPTVIDSGRMPEIFGSRSVFRGERPEGGGQREGPVGLPPRIAGEACDLFSHSPPSPLGWADEFDSISRGKRLPGGFGFRCAARGVPPHP